MSKSDDSHELPYGCTSIGLAGKGSFGTVIYIILYTFTGWIYAAIKFFKDKDANVRKREVAFLSLLTDEIRTVRMLDSGDMLNDPFIIFHATCGTLKDLMMKYRHPFPYWFVLYVAREVMLGLQAIHKHEIVHCDIKPSNIHFGRDIDVIIELLNVFSRSFFLVLLLSFFSRNL
jgi:serine/threonine protein kinase